MDQRSGGFDGAHGWRTAVLMAALVAAALDIGGCSRGDGGSEPGPTSARSVESKVERKASTTAAVASTVAVTATSTLRTPEEEVEAAYLAAMAAMFAEVRDPSAGAEVSLAKHFAGPSLAKTTDYVQNLVRKNRWVEYPNGREPVPSVTSVVVDGETATVLICVFDNAVVVAADGSVVDDDVVTVHFASTLLRAHDVWKVTQQAVVTQVEDGSPCP